jgi:hypothetical protein
MFGSCVFVFRVEPRGGGFEKDDEVRYAEWARKEEGMKKRIRG